MTTKSRTGTVADDATLAWLLLLAGTALAWWLGQTDRVGERAGSLATAGVIVVAFVKVWIVGFQFMELRHAPRWLRRGFDAWVVGVCLALVGICVG